MFKNEQDGTLKTVSEIRRLQVVYTSQDGIMQLKIHKESARELYEFIVNEDIENLGPVYSLALVSIITKGREPIYDRYAEIALDVIVKPDHGFRERLKYREMPDKSNVNAVMKRYKEYVKKLNSIFGDSWRIDKNGIEARKVDRALWTYGHLFK